MLSDKGVYRGTSLLLKPADSHLPELNPVSRGDYLVFIFLFLFFFKFYFIFKLYIIVLVLPNIKMSPPQVYIKGSSEWFKESVK